MTWPSWIRESPNADLVAIRGWGRQLYAIVVDDVGAHLHQQGADVLSCDTMEALVLSMSDDLRQAFALSAGTAAAADTAGGLAAAFARGQADTSSLETFLPCDVPIEPPPTSPDLDRYRAGMCQLAARALRRGLTGYAATAMQHARDVRPPRDAVDGFFWRDPSAVVAAADALAALPEGGDDRWRPLHLPCPVEHPSGVEVEWAALPVSPTLSRSVDRVLNASQRLARLLSLQAPPALLERDRARVQEALAALVERVHGCVGFQRAPQCQRGFPPVPSLALSRPPVGPRTGLMTPPHRAQDRLLLQLPERLLILGRDAVVAELPPCPWDMLFASSRHVVFCGALASDASPLEIAVLDLESNTWLEAWPTDSRGVASLSNGRLPEQNEHYSYWLFNPRTAMSWPLPGPVLAHSLQGGTAALIRDGSGLSVVEPEGPDDLVRTLQRGLPLSASCITPQAFDDKWTDLRFDVVTGVVTVLESEDIDWTPSPGVYALSKASGGHWHIVREGALYMDGRRVLVLDGEAVLKVIVEHGDSSRQSHLTVMTLDRVWLLEVWASDEDAGAQLIVRRSIPLP